MRNNNDDSNVWNSDPAHPQRQLAARLAAEGVLTPKAAAALSFFAARPDICSAFQAHTGAWGIRWRGQRLPADQFNLQIASDSANEADYAATLDAWVTAPQDVLPLTTDSGQFPSMASLRALTTYPPLPALDATPTPTPARWPLSAQDVTLAHAPLTVGCVTYAPLDEDDDAERNSGALGWLADHAISTLIWGIGATIAVIVWLFAFAWLAVVGLASLISALVSGLSRFILGG